MTDRTEYKFIFYIFYCLIEDTYLHYKHMSFDIKNVKYEFVFGSISHFPILAALFCSSPLNSVFNHYQCESNLVAQLNYL